ncbi:MAG: VWA domain-containing protein [Actinomycetota bacterium]
MIDALVGFVALLRREGVGVGSDRTLLAARALRLVDVADRTATRRALRLCLVVHGADDRRFDELFDRWFAGVSLDSALVARPDESVDDPPVPDTDEPEATVEATTAPDAYVDDPNERIAVAAEGAEADRRRAGDPSEPGDAQVAARFDATADVGELMAAPPGRPAERTDEGLPGDSKRIELAEDDDGGVDIDVAEMRRALDAAHDERLALLTAATTAPVAPLRPSSVLANPFDRDEQAELDAAVRALWPQLTGAPSWRRSPAAAGTLDLRRTLRSSVVTGGVPALVRRRAPTMRRPELLVLVDTSVSMRPYVRLTLHLAHALRRRPGRVRVLGFVDECVDVTDVIRHADLATALGGLLDDAPGGPLDPARPSDYGVAFGSLWHRFAALLRPSTTVLVLGDGRSGGRDPGLAHVEAVVRRCRRTVWWTPEAAGAWTFGNGEMAEYADRVDVAMTVRTLGDLRNVARTGVLREGSENSSHGRVA